MRIRLVLIRSRRQNRRERRYLVRLISALGSGPKPGCLSRKMTLTHRRAGLSGWSGYLIN